MRIRIFSDTGKLAEAAAAEIATWLRLDAGSPSVGLAGGSTPREAYRLLRSASLEWDDVHVWMTDERFVPADHPDSNVGMARAALADHVPARFHEVPHLPGDPEGSAAAYDKELGSFLGWSNGLAPGLVLLGMGADGHTASLFPGTAALEVAERRYVANWVPDRGEWRLTASLPLLGAARRTMFLVAGAAKAAAVARVLEGDGSDPAAQVSDASRDAVWLLDREAAGALSRSY